MNNDLLNILSNSNKDIDNQQLMDYLSGKLSEKERHEVEQSMAGSDFLNDAVEGLQKFDEKKDLRGYVEQLNASMQKTLKKKKARRERRRLKDQPWAYLAIILVLLLCFITYFLIRRFQH
jgi:anti-sigma factor RsiW